MVLVVRTKNCVCVTLDSGPNKTSGTVCPLALGAAIMHSKFKSKLKF